MAIQHLVKRIIETPHPNPQGCYICPTFSQAERVAWSYLKEATEVMPGVKYNSAKLRCEFPVPTGKATIYLLSGSNESSEQIRGLYLDICVLDEVADIPAKVFPQIIRPALADRRGSCVWIGTPKSEDAFKDIYDKARAKMDEGDPDWYACMFPVTETGVLSEQEVNELREQMSDSEFRAELLCDWGAAITGAYYADALERAEADGRIGQVSHDETLLVHTSFDLGVRDKTSIWFWQEHAGQVRLIDCYQASGEGLAHYVNVLQQRSFDHNYSYGDHIFPHDTDTRVLGETAQRRSDILRTLGIMPTVIPVRKVAEGIEFVRKILPICWFDKEKCAEGIKALKMYRVKESSGLPLHDEYSHFSDSFRYLATGYREGFSEGSAYRKKWGSELDYPNSHAIV